VCPSGKVRGGALGGGGGDAAVGGAAGAVAWGDDGTEGPGPEAAASVMELPYTPGRYLHHPMELNRRKKIAVV